VPTPPSERGAWLIALALGLLGAGVLAAVLSGAIGSTRRSAVAPPAVGLVPRAPTAATRGAPGRRGPGARSW
jgi:hypothetical protein